MYRVFSSLTREGKNKDKNRFPSSLEVKYE